MQSAAHFWNKMAERYAKSQINDEEAYRSTLERTRSHLNSTDRVLEVGCGTGSTALLLAGDVEHITATDFAATMIRIAEQKRRDQNVKNIDFRTADLFDNRNAGAPYDVVMALNVLHLLEDIPAALQRIDELLKPGGIFISKTPCLTGKEAPLKLRLMMTIIPLLQKLGKAPFVNVMAIDDLDRWIANAGFEVLEAQTRPVPSRYVVARKP